MRQQKFIFLFLFFFFISFTPKVFALTIVDTDITENTTWTQVQSPYLVKVPINIMDGVTLIIESGVIVKFDYGVDLSVEGVLNALGTKTEPIYFTSYADDSIGGDTNEDGGEFFPSAGDWGGLTVGSTNQLTLNHVSLRYGGGITLYNGGSIISDTLDSDQGILLIGSHSSFTNLTIPSIKIFNGSMVSIDTAKISNLDNDYDRGSSIYVYDDSSLTFKNAIVENTGFDDIVYIFGNSSANFDSVNITGNVFSGVGVYVFNNSSLNVNKSSITDSDSGLKVFDKSSVIFNDSLMKNTYSTYSGAVEVSDNSSFSANGSTFDTGFSDGIDVFSNTDGAKLTLSHSTVKNFLGSGVADFGGNNLYSSNVISIDHSTLTGNNIGLDIYNASRDAPSIVNVSNNSIYNNFSFGAQTYSNAVNLQLAENWWGDKTGPYNEISNPNGLGNAVSEYVLFKPFLTRDPLVEVTCCSSVLFLPGIEASRLYMPRANGSEDQLWEPNVNTDVEDLYLNTDGTSKNSGIYTRDIIKEANTPIPMGLAGPNVYKSFSNMMDQLVTDKKIAEWKPFAYDWRYSVDDIVNNGTKYQSGAVSLIETLQSLVDSSKNGKVTIITHSNGGLLAKALLKKLQDDKVAGKNNLIDSVDVLIMVAAPEIGTASAVPAILHGYDQSIAGGWLMDEVRAREVVRNMPGAYGLLPSMEYLNRVSASPTTFVDNLIPSQITTKLVQAFGSAIDSYAEYKNFLFGAEGRINPAITQTNFPISLSQNLFSKAESLHDKIDAFTPPASLRVIEVAGWGLDTVASFEYYPRLSNCSGSGGVCASYVLDERPRFTSDGDKTVVVPSAQYMSANGNAEKYWVDLPTHNKQLPLGLRKNRNHGDIFEVASLDNLIESVINKKDITLDTVLKNTEPTDDSNRLRLSIHSPVTLDAYDANGNHTGKICPPTSDFCYVEENIINSSYLEFGEGKYLNLPEDQFSKIKLQGTDVGTFTYDSEKVLPDGTSTTVTFADIPVTTQTQAEITLNQTGTPQLALDVTGDGIVDFTIAPNATFDPILFLQIMKKTVESFDISKQQKNTLLKRIDDTIKAIQNGKINKAKLKIEQFQKALAIHPKENDKDRQERERKNERDHEKEHRENRKPKQLAPVDVQTLLTLLNQLLDNLN